MFHSTGLFKKKPPKIPYGVLRRYFWVLFFKKHKYRMDRRDVVLGMAQRRAMEEQGERTNPLDGRGATPSMGLSQFRGGDAVARRKPLSAPPSRLSEAMEAGRHLGLHLSALHGKGYAEDFHKGMSGGYDSGAYQGEGVLKITHGGRKTQMEGCGTDEEMEGCGRVVGGRMKKVKKPLMEGDGRRSRGALIKKVMAEHGCSLPEASKYIKEHHLA